MKINQYKLWSGSISPYTLSIILWSQAPPAFPSINFVIYPQFSSRHNPANKQTDKQTNRQKNNADDYSTSCFVEKTTSGLCENIYNSKAKYK